MSDNKGNIEFYQSPNGDLQPDVKLHDDTVWLTQDQMTMLFDRDKSTISRHIKKIFSEEELTPESVVAKYATTASDGKTYQVEYYNLDVIISVGYRVKSKQGTQFRIWATNVLKDHLRKGYSLNTRRLQQYGADIKSLMSLLENAVGKYALAEPEAEEMIKIIRHYVSSFSLLQQYDEQTLKEPKGIKPSQTIQAEEARHAVAGLKAELIKRGEASDLFGKERGDSFAAIIGNIEQTFDGAPL